MSVDLSVELYDPIYELLPTAYDAVLTLLRTGETKALRVIDKTDGVEVSLGGDIDMRTTKPACAVRAAELVEKGIALADLKGSRIAFNDGAWEIDGRLEVKGEYYLTLLQVPTDA